MKEVSWKTWSVVAVLLVLLGWSTNYVRSQLASEGEGPVADYKISTGGPSGVVKVTVLDEEGHPLQLMHVQVDTDLGRVDEATNEVGEAILDCPGTIVTAVTVQRQLLLSRPLSVASGKPALKDGLEIHFVVKDLDAMRERFSGVLNRGSTTAKDLKKQALQEYNPLVIPRFPGLQSPKSVLGAELEDSTTDE